MLDTIDCTHITMNDQIQQAWNLLSDKERAFVKANREGRPGAELLRQECEFIGRELYSLMNPGK